MYPYIVLKTAADVLMTSRIMYIDTFKKYTNES